MKHFTFTVDKEPVDPIEFAKQWGITPSNIDEACEAIMDVMAKKLIETLSDLEEGRDDT